MSIEALKLALEALEADEQDMVADKDGHMVFRVDAAITAIRQAIEQAEQAQPVAAGARCEVIENCKKCKHSMGRKTCALAGRDFDGLARSPAPPEWCPLPLYTEAPPPRQPLTDEQISALLPEADGTAEANTVWVKDGDFPYCEYEEVDAWSRPLVIQIARAIEAAHGIKGEA